MKSIDLGRKVPEIASMPVSPEDTRDVFYPTLYIDNVKGLKGLPDGGVLTVRFKKVRSTVEEVDGKKTASATLEIREILDCEGEDSRKDDRGEHLDKLAAEEGYED
jgi:hypothetical protein